jgi:MFS superfamily sulfate permease-like transporter
VKSTLEQKYSRIVDVQAGLVVFLIALPLSLGISLASGAPSSAGLISVVLGGLLGAFLGGSYVTINGPAAGLIVVVLSAIQNLGEGDPVLGFRRMLACAVVVGVLQIFSGVFKAGRFAAIFPISVVNGMLASIGLIIMIKQGHVFFGHNLKGSLFSSIGSMPDSIANLVPESAIIGLFGIVVLLLYPHLKFKLAKVIPAPLVVAIGGIALASFLKPEAMVKIPLNPLEFIITPSFDVLLSTQSIISIITIYFVASLESILSASAVDQLDPLQRESDFNRELWSKGIVNLGCGLIGGLPIIAEIVRSSANISQGARTPLANFSHSVFTLIFILLFPGILNSIPLSALAAILLLVGYRLANPHQFKSMWQLGPISFISFMTTIVVTIGEDLLLGIIAGVVVKIVGLLISGVKFRDLIKPTYNLKENGSSAILDFEVSLTFFSALKQKEIMSKISSFKEVYIDLTRLTYIDPTSLKLITKEAAKLEKNGVTVTIKMSTEFELMSQKIQGN